MLLLDILLISIALFILAAIFVPLIYALYKKKYWIILAQLAVALCIVIFCYLFPTRFPYMDHWIMGKTKDQIIAVYGEPTVGWYNSDKSLCYDLGKSKITFGLSPPHELYVIYFDENGEAYEIKIMGIPGG